MSDRRLALRAYLLAVAKDLAASGNVRRKAGQSLDDILRAEPMAVIAGVHHDLVSVGKELGVGFALGLGTMLRNGLGGPVGELGEAAGRALADWVAGKRKTG